MKHEAMMCSDMYIWNALHIGTRVYVSMCVYVCLLVSIRGCTTSHHLKLTGM